MLKRLGSAIPAEADRLLPGGQRNPLPDDCLPFSNGRAALAWVLGRKVEYRSALVCAYNCPALVRFLRGKGLHVGVFDIGAAAQEIERVRERLETPCMVLLSPGTTKPELRGDLVIVDAMQTAFGHLDYADGWVLSGPRKTTACLDGAILRFPGAAKYRNEIMSLGLAAQARAWKSLAYHYWSEGADGGGLTMNRCAEENWPTQPARMHEESINWLERLDCEWHKKKRAENYVHMLKLLPREWHVRVPDGCPFSFQLLVSNPNELVAHLKAQRIYASRLWLDAEHDPQKHSRAHVLTQHLISLPIDQRCEPHDIDRIARAVLEVAEPMENGI